MKITLSQNAIRLHSCEHAAAQWIQECDISPTSLSVTLHPADFEMMPEQFKARCISVTIA